MGPDNRIVGFEVLASESDTLDVADVLERADQYDFSSSKDPISQRVFFTAQSKDKKTRIVFEVRGHETVLSRVAYTY